MRPKLVLFFCLLAGCQSVPRASAPREPPPVPIIRFCHHEIPVEDTAIKQVVMQIVVSGMPIDGARERLTALGFQVLGRMPKSYVRPLANLPLVNADFNKKTERNINSVKFKTCSDEIGAWGQRYFELRLVLYFDETLTVTDIEIPRVPSKGRTTQFAWYFSRRPRLREPLGMPLEQARVLMESEGFRCVPVASDKHEGSGRPYLYCRAMAETPLGGSIIRVRLFYDEAGNVTDTYVTKQPELFDELLCMLPDKSDDLTHALIKTIVFPARLYASLLVGGLEADLAMGRP